jgi:murein L,D-transpeptidase YcbB/YkuD
MLRYTRLLLCALAYVGPFVLPVLAADIETGATTGHAAQDEPSPTEDETIRRVLDEALHPHMRWGRFPDHRDDVRRLYEDTGFRLIWTRDDAPTDQAWAVILSFLEAETRGLRATDYDAEWLEEKARALDSDLEAAPEEMALFDLAVTISLMRYLSDLRVGRIDPRAAGFDLDIEAKRLDLPAVVHDIARTADPRQRVAAVEPRFPLYEPLEGALARYRRLADEPGLSLPALPLLHPGESHPAMPNLRRLLTALGDLPDEVGPSPHSEVYDEDLVAAVKQFQRRHGLEIDGVVGRETRRALRVPMAARVEQIEMALERLRWLPERFGQRFLLVNIPEFRLRGFTRGVAEPVLETNVIVGSAIRRHETPVLHADMRYVIFRPYWQVPLSITRKEMLPRLTHDPGYLAKEGLEIIERTDGPTVVHPPTRENLARLAAGTLRLRQRPGPRNALGLVKFIFPNRADVCMHSTPAVELFRHSRRDFSHGCIRVEDPVPLAVFALAGHEEWGRKQIEQTMYGARSLRVDLASPIPVYLFYTTVVASPSGEVLFFDDIYGHDKSLKRLLATGYAHTR